MVRIHSGVPFPKHVRTGLPRISALQIQSTEYGERYGGGFAQEIWPEFVALFVNLACLGSDPARHASALVTPAREPAATVHQPTNSIATPLNYEYLCRWRPGKGAVLPAKVVPAWERPGAVKSAVVRV